MTNLRTEWTFSGTTYEFSYPVTRAWAARYLKESGEM